MHPPHTVLILAHHSLLLSGIASMLQEYRSMLNVHLIKSEGTDFAELIHAQEPEIIILDSSDTELTEKTPVTKLLEWAPKAKVIHLDQDRDVVRVYSGIELPVSNAVDFVGIIQSISNIEVSQ